MFRRSAYPFGQVKTKMYLPESPFFQRFIYRCKRASTYVDAGYDKQLFCITLVLYMDKDGHDVEFQICISNKRTHLFHRFHTIFYQSVIFIYNALHNFIADSELLLHSYKLFLNKVRSCISYILHIHFCIVNYRYPCFFGYVLVMHIFCYENIIFYNNSYNRFQIMSRSIIEIVLLLQWHFVTKCFLFL